MKIDVSHMDNLILQLLHQKIIGPLMDPTGQTDSIFTIKPDVKYAIT